MATNTAIAMTAARGIASRRYRSAQRVERAREAVAQVHLRLPAELFPRARGVDRDALHLTRTLGRELRLERLVAADLAQDVDELEHARLAAGADVVGTGRVGLGCREVRGDDVADPVVVARLLAVAEDGRPRALEQLAAEDRDHARLAERVLARAVDVAVAQRHRRESVQPPEQGAVVLGAELRVAVRRHRRDRMVLRRRQYLPLAVDRPAGRRVHEAPDARLE